MVKSGVGGDWGPFSTKDDVTNTVAKSSAEQEVKSNSIVLDILKAMKEELEGEIINIHTNEYDAVAKARHEKRISDHHIFLRNSFRYRFDKCVYKETEDESCKSGSVDLGIDKICCDIQVWDFYYWHQQINCQWSDSNITIDDKTYEHDFVSCIDGIYNINGTIM